MNDFNESLFRWIQITPRCFLIGHSGTILSIAYIPMGTGSFDLVVSSSDNGQVFKRRVLIIIQKLIWICSLTSRELCNWDAGDGRCLESNKCGNAHSKLLVGSIVVSILY